MTPRIITIGKKLDINGLQNSAYVLHLNCIKTARGQINFSNTYTEMACGV